MNTPKKKTILLVESDSAQQILEKVLLEQAGYKVLLAENANNARNILQKERVDLITTAIMLPLESSFDFIQSIRNCD